MLLNKRFLPIEVQVNEALQNRFPQSHRLMPEILTEIKMRRAGFRGERYLDYHLSHTPYNKYFIFSDLRLEIYGSPFQIDSLVVNRSFTLIIDVKDWEGIIKYDSDKNQILQIKGNSISRHDDPVLQADRQKNRLESWLHKHNCKLPPIHTLVTLSNKKALLVFERQNESTQKIVYIDSIIEKLNELDTANPKNLITLNDIKDVSLTFTKNYSHKKVDALKKFNISPNEIILGVECPCCHKFCMVRKRRTWFCPTCKIHSSDAHVKGIMEFLLINSSITPEQCRLFLKLPIGSKNLVTTLLKGMNLVSTGNTHNRKYFLPQVSYQYHTIFDEK